MKKVINTDSAPNAIGPYSQAIESDGFVYLSGQIPLDPKTGKLVGDTIEERTKQVMSNLRAVLKESGLTFNNVVKTTIYCTDLENFNKINEVYGSYLSKPFPARATVQVAALPLGTDIEIDMIAKK